MELYEDSVVAFIDILAFREAITDETKTRKLMEALKFLKSRESIEEWDTSVIAMEESAQLLGVDQFDVSTAISVSCFSDSMVVTIRINDKVQISELMSTLVAHLSIIGSHLLLHGILIRGGIHRGEMMHTKDGIIMGPAMIRAYELENKFAIYPRIVISDELFKELGFHSEGKKRDIPVRQYLQRFEDRSVGFHQMIVYQVLQNYEEGLPKGKLKEDLDAIRLFIIQELNRTEDKNVFAKINWLRGAYNKLYIYIDGCEVREIKCIDDDVRSSDFDYR